MVRIYERPEPPRVWYSSNTQCICVQPCSSVAKVIQLSRQVTLPTLRYITTVRDLYWPIYSVTPRGDSRSSAILRDARAAQCDPWKQGWKFQG